MIVPYKYVINKHVKPAILIENGFESRLGTYHYKQKLLGQIYLEIEIDLQDHWMRYFVKISGINEYYVPFYHEEYRIHNRLYPIVARRFNNVMDELCHKQILWREHYVNKSPYRRYYNSG